MEQTNKYLLLVLCIMMSLFARGQWEVEAEGGIAFPYGGYKAVEKSGRLLGISAGHRFSKERWTIDLSIDWARLHRDKNKLDVFENAKLDVVPMLFTLKREFSNRSLISPYVGAGMGASLYNILYHHPVRGDVADVNASFTMTALTGIYFKTESNILSYIQLRAVIVADGPPIGFPDADKTTGFYGLTVGISYRFQ